ncbi:MAG: hypothetical protein IT383_13080 [Deltaproteobacteria bacterium]|nr:hypothetical protein [Deltaproteobacteria bacterium]
MRLLMMAFVLLASATALAVPRVYLVPLRAPNVDRAVTEVLAEQLLVSARRHQGLYEVLGATDLKTVLDLEAAKAAMGCDSDSCANEIADALNAEQLLAGQVGRIGDVWLLTLTRTEKSTLKVLSRVSVEARGDSPSALLPLIPSVVDEALGVERPLKVWAWTGGAVAGVGVLALAGAGGLYALSLVEFEAAKTALDPAEFNVTRAAQARDWSKGYYTAFVVTGATGGGLVVVGAATVVISLLAEE